MFISGSGYYDVQSKDGSDDVVVFVPDVKASSSDEALKLVAQQKHVSVEQLEVFEASNPGYREV